MEQNEVLKSFRDHGIPCFGRRRPEYNGWQIICTDRNHDPAASVIQHKYSYGSKADRLEVGWLDKKGELIQSEDVIGWLTLDEAVDLVEERLVKYRKFRPRKKAAE